MRSFFLFSGLLAICGTALGQLFQQPVYPSGEFRNPLNIPISLAANFGELRENHYHMGLDIRTNHRENLPVFATADGYILRIKIEPFGFGQAVYIKHDNGYVSLYAHLNAFYPALASYVRQKQYEFERWDISLDLPPGLLKVKKGDLIAYSGNMGGSQGPHLHFEIRNYPEDVNLNPMLFGLPIADNTRPVIRSLSIYDRTRSFYEQSPKIIQVKEKGGKFSLVQPLVVVNSTNPGFGISAFDTQTGSSNPNGIYQAVLYENGSALTGFRMDHISYNDTRGINAHIDYPTRQRGGPYYQLLFRLPGYRQSIYHESPAGSALHLEDGQVHNIRIEVKDAYNNTSNIEFKLQYRSEPGSGTNYQGKTFYPGMVDGFEGANAAFYLTENCLYDSAHIFYGESQAEEPDAVSGLHHIGSNLIPLADSMVVRIKLSRLQNQKDHVLMQCFDKSDYTVKKPNWLGEWATASFRNFGNFRLVVDTIPPDIIVPGIVDNSNLSRSSRIAIIVRDNYKTIKNFRATLDGKWLLFTNDKTRAFIYNFDERCASGRHELKIYAEDEAGNSSGVILHFSR
jgi:murein DD-endopeptidase MepM/ murein hydrolase activator NlpD